MNQFRGVNVGGKVEEADEWADHYGKIAQRIPGGKTFLLLQGLIFPDNIQRLIVILNIPNTLDNFQYFK